MESSRIVALCAVLSGLGASANAQGWSDRSDRPYAPGVDFLSEAFAGRPLLIRDWVIWSWDGTVWKQLGRAVVTPVTEEAWAFDQQTRTLVFLYRGTSALETWTFDGAQWTGHGPAPSPDLGRLHYDPTQRAVVAFEDNRTTGTTQDWQWNGASWVALTAGRRPPGLRGDPVVDTGRGTVIVVGEGGSPFAGQTWEWDGVQWTRRAPSSSLPLRYRAAMAYDPLRRRVVRFGGSDLTTGAWHNDTWEWDGSGWTFVPSPGLPPGDAHYRLAFDAARETIVLFDLAHRSGTDWEWDGMAWTRLASAPPPSTYAVSTTDFARRRLVRLQGDFGNSTWEWDGNSWTEFVGLAPPPRDTTLTWDPVSGDCVLFGGSTRYLQTFFGDTWSWDGRGYWVQATTPTAPSPRAMHALAPHRASGGVVLFGGIDSNRQQLRDTWLWAGGVWTDLTATLPSAPPGGPSMFEAGVHNGDPLLVSGNELWRWTGSWQRVNVGVPVDIFDAFGHDPVAARPVLIGRLAGGSLPLCWEWNGTQWENRLVPALTLRSAAHDPLRGNLMVFSDGEPLVSTATPADESRYGSGCGSPAPIQLTQGRPRIATPGFRLAARVGPAAPAVFLLGLQSANQPLGGGCVLRIGAPQVVGIASANASGHASLQLPIPGVAALRGVDLYAQALTVQPQGPLGGIALSDGLRITIGD